MRLRLLVALCLLAGALTACGGDGDEPSGSDDAQSGRVAGTLEFWFLDEQARDQEWWNDLVADFEREYPDVEVKVTKYNTSSLKEKVLAAFASENEPDVFFNNGGDELFKYVERGLIEPLDEIVDMTLYNEALVEAGKYEDGKSYSIPISLGTPFGLWYDKRLFSREGLKPPETMSELLSMCDRLSAADIVPIALGNSEQWPALMWLDTFIYQYAGASGTLDATFGRNGASWDSPEFQQAAQRVVDLVDGGCFPSGFNGLSYAQQTNLFFSGSAAMTLLGEWAVTTAEAEAPKGFELDYFLVPDADDARHSTASGEGIEVSGSGLSVSARSDNKTAAARLLDFYGERVNSGDIESGRLPSAATAPSGLTPLQDKMLADAKKAEDLFGPGDVILPADIHSELYQGLQELTLGDVSPAEWGARMEDAVEEVRDEG